MVHLTKAPKGNRRFQILKHHTLCSILNFGSVTLLRIVTRSVLHRSQGVFSAFWLTFCHQLLGQSLHVFHVFQFWYWLPSRSKTQLIHPDTQTKTRRLLSWPIRLDDIFLRFLLHEEIFWRVFLRHRTFISIIWSWAGQFSTQDGVEKVKRRLSNKIWALRQEKI